MQVTNSQPSFTSIYRIKNTPKNIKEIEEKVLPMYTFLKHEKVAVFEGDNPFEIVFDVIKEIVADSNHASKLWLEMNAKIHGQILPDSNMDFLHIISSNKDVQDFIGYITKRQKAYENKPIKRIKEFFKSVLTPQERKDLPEHLQIMEEASKAYNTEREEYQKFLNGKDVVNVSSTQELLAKMLTEK